VMMCVAPSKKKNCSGIRLVQPRSKYFVTRPTYF
jgi:hypothetical protein